MCRGSLACSCAIRRASAEGVTLASGTRRPSALETTFWQTTSTPPRRASPAFAAACASNAARSSPGATSGTPRSGARRSPSGSCLAALIPPPPRPAPGGSPACAAPRCRPRAARRDPRARPRRSRAKATRARRRPRRRGAASSRCRLALPLPNPAGITSRGTRSSAQVPPSREGGQRDAAAGQRAEQVLDLGGACAGDVAEHDEHAVGRARGDDRGGRFDRGVQPGVGPQQHLGARAASGGGDRGVRRHHHDPRQGRHARAAHPPRRTSIARQSRSTSARDSCRSEPRLRTRERLRGHDCRDHGIRAASLSAASARRVACASSRMMVSVTQVRSPSARRSGSSAASR